MKFTSFKTQTTRLTKYSLEIGIIALATVVFFCSLFIFLTTLSIAQEPKSPHTSDLSFLEEFQIVVEISGSINKPGIYKVKTGARIGDLINLAGGFMEGANLGYISKNINQAQKLSDEQKIYIPSKNEASFFDMAPQDSATNTQKVSTLIDINAATTQELDSLSGIGPVTIGKITAGRPYKSTEELLDRKIISKPVFLNIKDLITAN